MKCDICEKESKHYRKVDNKIYCPKHYQQLLKFGHILDRNSRTTKDLNDFEIHEDYTVIYTYNKNSERNGSFIIDTEDLEKVIIYKWRVCKNRIYTGVFKTVQLHRFILGDIPENKVVDHINHNPLDNRKANLRITTQANNVKNKLLQSNNNSGFAGVWFEHKRNKWCSEIYFEGKKCFLGRHNKLCDAVYVKYIAEKIMFKEFRSSQNDDNILKIITECHNKAILNDYVKKRLFDRYNINKYQVTEGI